jgi:ABC-2 type transport system permease protein
MTTIEQQDVARSGEVVGAPDASGPRPWFIVAMREIVVRLTNRAFIVSTLVTLALIAGFGAWSVWQANRTTTYAIAVTDQDGGRVVSEAATTARRIDDKVEITATSVADQSAARSAVEAGDAVGWLHRVGDGWVLTTSDQVDVGLQTALESAVRDSALTTNAAAAGTTVDALSKGSTLTTARFDGAAANEGFVRAATFAFALLFFMAAMMFGQQIAASVVEEKQSRLVEILATAIPLRQLLAGKIVGNSLIALAQVVLFAAVGLVALSFTQWSTLLPSLSTAVGWFVLFFTVGFFALACLFAVGGALASRTEDLQSTTAPVTMVLTLVYVMSISLTGAGLKVASFVPIVSVIAMPARILSGDARWWEAALALLIMAVFSAGTVMLGERIYRRSLMQTRGRVSWRQAMATEE